MSDESSDPFDHLSDEQLVFAGEVIRQLCNEDRLSDEGYGWLVLTIAGRKDAILGRQVDPSTDRVGMTDNGEIAFRTDDNDPNSILG